MIKGKQVFNATGAVDCPEDRIRTYHRARSQIFDRIKQQIPDPAIVSRSCMPVLELYQNSDGSVTIPEVLRPYMGGKEKLE